jgi:hypothetical protein
MMKIEKSLWIGVFMIALSLLAMPMGFAAKAKNPPPGGSRMLSKPATSSMTEMYAASNPSGSCKSLGLNGQAVGYAQLVHGSVIVSIQKGQSATYYNVTVIKLGNGESDKSWVCGSSSQNVGSITTDLSGQGQLYQTFKASKGTKYVVELLDNQGHVLYASYAVTA